MESEFKSISLMQPIIFAPNLRSLFPSMDSKYKWVGSCEISNVSESEYDNSGLDKERTFATIYPPQPSEKYLGEYYMVQNSYHSQHY